MTETRNHSKFHTEIVMLHPQIYFKRREPIEPLKRENYPTLKQSSSPPKTPLRSLPRLNGLRTWKNIVPNAEVYLLPLLCITSFETRKLACNPNWKYTRDRWQWGNEGSV
jgi:hypothetical protein